MFIVLELVLILVLLILVLISTDSQGILTLGGSTVPPVLVSLVALLLGVFITLPLIRQKSSLKKESPKSKWFGSKPKSDSKNQEKNKETK